MYEKNMRLVQILTRPGGTEPILEILQEEKLDYSVSENADEDGGRIISFPVPATAVEPILDRLDEEGVDERAYTVILDAEAVVTERFNHLEEEQGQVSPTQSQRISRDELRSNAQDMLPDVGIYAVLTAIGAIVATAGFLLNSLAVLIGSMIIAPLFGPPMATAVATVTNDDGLLSQSVRTLGIGVFVGAFASFSMALAVRFSPIGGSIFDFGTIVSTSSYGSSVFLLVIVAFAAGVAGAIGMSTGDSTVLTAVMLASALVPPIAVVGIGLAWLIPALMLGATAVLLVNLLAIELASIVTLWYLGYHPTSWSQLRSTRSTILKLVLVLTALIATLALFLVELTRGELSGIIQSII